MNTLPNSIVSVRGELQHGTVKVFVTAEAGTHHSTIVSAANLYVRSLPNPDYVSSVTGKRPGKWCLPMYSGPWIRVGSGLVADRHIRKTFTAWPVPE